MSENESENNNAKNTASAVWKSITEVADKVIASSKKGLESAGSAINEFGDKSVLRIELTQLKSKLGKLYKEFGEYAAESLSAGTLDAIDNSDLKTADFLNQIKSVQENIAKHEEEIAAKQKSNKADETEPADSEAISTDE